MFYLKNESVLVLATTLALLTNCQSQPNSRTTDNKDQPTNPIKKEIALEKTIDYSQCKTIKSPTSINGTWILREESKDGFKLKISLQIINKDLYLTNTFSENDLTCEVSVAIQLGDVTNSSFTVLKPEQKSKKVQGKTEGHILECTAALEAKTYNYSYDGGCLKIENGAEPVEFIPSTLDAESKPATNDSF